MSEFDIDVFCDETYMNSGNGPDAVKAGFHKGREVAEAERWVSVEERLPEVAAIVSVLRKGNYPAIGSVDSNGYWYWPYMDRIYEEVTHWAELPTPPQVKEVRE